MSRKRIVEFTEMVRNHNLYSGEKLVIDWEKLCIDEMMQNVPVVVLCSSDGYRLTWIEKATEQEIKELYEDWKIDY